MHEDDLITEERPLSLPINLGLNDGTICPQSCIDVMQQHNSRTSLRHYTTADNEPLLDVICKVDGVNPENIYLAHGSGPILKQCIPYLIRKKIKGSTRRIARHLISKSGFPIISGHLTYFKVPLKAMNLGLTVRLLPLKPDNDFKLMVDDVEGVLKKGDGLVYICNPNNPTGQLMMERDEVEYLAKKYPSSLFWVDEAYVQYLDRAEHQYLSDLVPQYDNLCVSRTFSFAYGLAGVRMGYLLSSAERIKEFESQVTNYRFGTLQEKLAAAALTDTDHLVQLRKMTAIDRDSVMAHLKRYEGLETYESKTHFILCKFTDERTGQWLGDELNKRGIKIKVFKAVPGQDYTSYFRITLGVKNENAYLCEQLDDLLG